MLKIGGKLNSEMWWIPQTVQNEIVAIMLLLEINLGVGSYADVI